MKQINFNISEIKDESSKIKELFHYLDNVTFKKEEKERFISEVKSESIKHWKIYKMMLLKKSLPKRYQS